MEDIEKEVNQFVTLGKEYIIRGQYEKAYSSYNKALEHNPDHYLIRNALGEVYFIKKEFISAADNFWLAALDHSSCLDFQLMTNDKIVDPTQLKIKNQTIYKAKKIALDYAGKTGLALFADQYEDPLKKNTQQALINLYRREIDPCGYQGFVDAEPDKIIRVEKNIQMIGYRFLMKMSAERLDREREQIPLEKLLTHVKILF